MRILRQLLAVGNRGLRRRALGLGQVRRQVLSCVLHAFGGQARAAFHRTAKVCGARADAVCANIRDLTQCALVPKGAQGQVHFFCGAVSQVKRIRRTMATTKNVTCEQDILYQIGTD